MQCLADLNISRALLCLVSLMHGINCILTYVVLTLLTFCNILVRFIKPAERKVFSINDSVTIKFFNKASIKST